MRRPVVAWAAAMSGLALAAAILWLNLREEDFYPHALAEPPAEPINSAPPSWLPEGATLTECRIAIRVEDRDGWYRLFWAGTDVYHYDDPAHFAAALANPTASYSGRWTIKGTHGDKPFTLELTLQESPPDPRIARTAPFDVPASTPWFTRDYTTGLRTFSWRLESP